MISNPNRQRSRVRFGRIALGLLLLTPSLGLGGDPAPPSPDATGGRWILDFERDGSVQLTLRRRSDGHGSWSSSNDYVLQDFQGLQRPSSPAEVPATFTMVRDAGTVRFEGQLGASGGSGRFVFAENPEYVAALASMGYRAVDREELFSLAVHDVSRRFIHDLDALGYPHVPLDDLVSMRITAPSSSASSGARLRPPPDDLVSMRIHGASPEFIRELKALGYERLSADDLVSMRIHGASPELVRALKELGYPRLTADDLVSMCIHGATPEFIRALAALGYRDLSPDDLVSMRIHGVTPNSSAIFRASAIATCRPTTW